MKLTGSMLQLVNTTSHRGYADREGIRSRHRGAEEGARAAAGSTRSAGSTRPTRAHRAAAPGAGAARAGGARSGGRRGAERIPSAGREQPRARRDGDQGRGQQSTHVHLLSRVGGGGSIRASVAPPGFCNPRCRRSAIDHNSPMVTARSGMSEPNGESDCQGGGTWRTMVCELLCAENVLGRPIPPQTAGRGLSRGLLGLGRLRSATPMNARTPSPSQETQCHRPTG